MGTGQGASRDVDDDEHGPLHRGGIRGRGVLMPFWSWTGTATQSNAAGGIVRIDVTAGEGNSIHVLCARTVGAFGAADNLDFLLVDEDNTTVIALGGVGAATAPIMTLPRAFTNVDSTTNTAFASSLGGIKLVGPDRSE